MSSIASSSSSTSSSLALAQESEVRPQAGPLPSKAGEIGYNDEIHRRGRDEDLESRTAEGDAMVAGARHPADRAAPLPAIHTATLTPLSGATSQTATAPEDSFSTHSLGKRNIISFFKQKKPTVKGLRLWTISLFLIQFLLAGGTIAGWVLTIKKINHDSQGNSNGNQSESNPLPLASSAIFIHVLFAIGLIAQLLMLERRVFRLRAERYSHLHPGEILPISLTRGNRFGYGGPNMGLAPWQRPPLPTYAADLARSGLGTGDVEDNIIAIPPPPVYGHTRGSRLLLQGYLRESLRAQRPVSVHTQMSQVSPRAVEGEDGERPLSYATQDSQWQEITDAEQARKLEQTLAQLEEGSQSAVVSAETR